jgi:hypothetical protein
MLNAVAPGPCNARWYAAPEPETIVPDRLTLRPASAAATSGKVGGIELPHFARSVGYADRNAHFWYFRALGAV